MKLLRNLLDFLRGYMQWFFAQRQQLRIAVLGLQNSGKSTFTAFLTGEPFQADVVPTLGANIKRATIGQTSIQIYDLAGQLRFRFLWGRYLQKVDLIVYVMDLSDHTCWEQSKSTLHEVLVATNTERVPVLVLGNKKDLTDVPLSVGQTEPTQGQSYRSQQSNTTANLSSPSSPSDPSPYQWKFIKPLLSHYDYDDIPKFNLDGTNQHILKDIHILSKEIGIDLCNGILHTTSDTTLTMDRDVGIFTISCKQGTCMQEVIDWILQI
ncbi:HHL245Cp [Eremothecium sinecaudum]|uniref:HHL245Cp n=1 Tax=Eremothecium sinecaudum TaxID=45286 RepID=A0A0X8HW21_9SACH|nr:HHL245Cp [Eremothecium sinecaudum]AMD22525.1 HHL245Cp [Eremothecium sinecaudum]